MVGAKDFPLKKNIFVCSTVLGISETSILVFTYLKMYSPFYFGDYVMVTY